MYKLIVPYTYQEKSVKFLKHHPELRKQYAKTISLLEQNPYHPSLRLHKFSDLYSVSINMQYRIAIDFIVVNNQIILINIGDHKEIYGKE